MSFPLRFDISLKLLPAMAERVPHFAVDRAKRTLTRDVELGRRVFWWTGPGLGTEYWLRTVALEITHAMADGRSGREQPVIPVVVECTPGQRKEQLLDHIFGRLVDDWQVFAERRGASSRLMPPQPPGRGARVVVNDAGDHRKTWLCDGLRTLEHSDAYARYALWLLGAEEGFREGLAEVLKWFDELPIGFQPRALALFGGPLTDVDLRERQDSSRNHHWERRLAPGLEYFDASAWLRKSLPGLKTEQTQELIDWTGLHPEVVTTVASRLAQGTSVDLRRALRGSMTVLDELFESVFAYVDGGRKLPYRGADLACEHAIFQLLAEVGAEGLTQPEVERELRMRELRPYLMPWLATGMIVRDMRQSPTHLRVSSKLFVDWYLDRVL